MDTKIYKELISVKDYDRALRMVSELGNLDIVKNLVSQGADIHTCDDFPLRIASCCGNLEVVQYLLENGADMYADDIHYRRDNIRECQALRMACWNGHLKVVKCLVENGVDIPDMDFFSDTQHSEIVEYMKLIKFLKILSKHWRERQKFIKK